LLYLNFQGVDFFLPAVSGVCLGFGCQDIIAVFFIYRSCDLAIILRLERTSMIPSTPIYQEKLLKPPTLNVSQHNFQLPVHKKISSLQTYISNQKNIYMFGTLHL